MEVQNPLHDIVGQLSKLPGIGPKSAQRLSFFFLSLSKKEVAEFARVVVHTRENIRYCETCFNIAFSERCHICINPLRQAKQLCVVAEPKDVFAIERTQEYKGVYHVLGGVVSPIDGIHPDSLRMAELMDRIKTQGIEEIILAINSTIEGDATVHYLSYLLKEFPGKKTKLAYGLPVGADMDYTDDLTLRKALLGRTGL